MTDLQSTPLTPAEEPSPSPDPEIDPANAPSEMPPIGPGPAAPDDGRPRD